MDPWFPRCQIVPDVDGRTRFLIDGRERLVWNFRRDLPRPCFHPLIGPSGVPLTRMGHPGAPDHDHHQGIWFAHHKVLGINFWGNDGPATIRQEQWLAYVDGDDEARMAVRLGWYDGHDPQPLFQQDVVAALRPGDHGELELELQTTLTPTALELELGKTNFGLLAVRVAKSLSNVFGGGTLSDSESRRGEPAIFGQRARWVDDSGPVAPDVIEGLTYFDHPGNPGYPSHWHVRNDGWFTASLCFAESRLLRQAEPLTLRYLLWAHAGDCDPERANTVAERFTASAAYRVVKSTRPHHAFEIERAAG